MCDRPLQYKRNRRSHLLKLVFSKNVAFFNLVPLQVCVPKAWFQSMFCMFRIFLLIELRTCFFRVYVHRILAWFQKLYYC